MPRSAQSATATIADFLDSVEKTANEKAADGGTPLSEPGSIGGETSHPVKKVDDRLQKAKEGERSAENTKDVKNDQGAPSVENAAEASTKNASAATIFGVAASFAKKAEGAVSTPGSAADDHISTTTKVAPTGEDPAHETNSAKAGKEDKKQGGVGGTSHPASTENNQLDGHKYAADTPLEKLAADMKNLADGFLAGLHHAYQAAGQTPTKTASASAAPQPQARPQATIDPQLAAYVGNEMAGLIGGTFDKQAADKMVRDTLYAVVKQAADDADLFIAYGRDFLRKQAEGDEPEPEPSAGGGGEPSAPAAGGGGEAGAGGGGEEEAMLASLGGGAGGDPMGGGGDPMGGAGGGDQEAMMLAKVLEQLGVSPEELEAAIAAQQGGGGGMGGDPMAAMGGGGAAPAGGGGAMPAGGGMETQANVGGGKRNTAHPTKEAEMRNYISEIVRRSRK